ncbi:MAG: hypothetical protein GY941_27900 [Planctomycetes bacterium]|nr:hypothetical protein [Planctomycetota bacterium]
MNEVISKTITGPDLQASRVVSAANKLEQVAIRINTAVTAMRLIKGYKVREILDEISEMLVDVEQASEQLAVELDELKFEVSG